ncbi:hypothetical protein ANCCEY_05318 [Ancylostoma ceylanicum]|uniref:Uncharacterized protein n=1 Tax=Ancylostoma ceylanicum TaxID=53326 RepID=A0A0D6LUN7_9BILA|nr:hypothetical protein ANCCEY_05318 [Ancylostoma ceylanicum]
MVLAWEMGGLCRAAAWSARSSSRWGRRNGVGVRALFRSAGVLCFITLLFERVRTTIVEPDTSYYHYTVPKSYDSWNGEDERVIERTSYTVSKVPFYGETTNRSQYTWKDPVSNKPRTSNESHEDRPNPPFYSETTNRAVYSPKALKRTVESRNQSEEEVERPRIPFYSETTNQSEYVEKVVSKTAPTRKPASDPLPQIPFNSETTNMSEFTSKKAQRGCPAERFLGTKKWKARYQNGHWWFREAYRMPIKTEEQSDEHVPKD